MLNQQLWVESEGGCWYLFHPDDLTHRQNDPMDWIGYRFAIGKEFVAGHLIAIGTGSDSVWKIRFTDEGLTEAEAAHVTASVEFRLQVRHECLCLDGGDRLPYADIFPARRFQSGESYQEIPLDILTNDYEYMDDDREINIEEFLDENDYEGDEGWGEEENHGLAGINSGSDDSDPYNRSESDENCDFTDEFLPPEQSAWIHLPNGDYQAVVYTFDWGSQAEGQECPSYTVVLKAVADLGGITYPVAIPSLIEGESLFEGPDPYRHWREKAEAPLETEYALLDWGEVIFPGIDGERTPTPDQYRHIQQIKNCYYQTGDDDKSIVVGHNLAVGSIGTLFDLDGFGYADGTLFISGIGIRFVQLIRVFERDGIRWANVEPFDTPEVAVNREAVDLLKHQFARYAQTNPEYAQWIPYPQFFAERIQSLTVPREVCWAIADTLNLPPETQLRLLTLGEPEFMSQLSEILNAKILN